MKYRTFRFVKTLAMSGWGFLSFTFRSLKSFTLSVTKANWWPVEFGPVTQSAKASRMMASAMFFSRMKGAFFSTPFLPPGA